MNASRKAIAALRDNHSGRAVARASICLSIIADMPPVKIAFFARIAARGRSLQSARAYEKDS
jgi:CTP:molybdopterin cytidylyltransferase MocA